MTMTDMVTIVTGGTKGMGLAISERFAAEGARVALCSRSEADSLAVADDLNRRFGNGKEIALGLRCDIEVKADLEALVASTLSRWNKVDALVCGASTLPWLGPSLETPDETLDQQFNAVFKSKWWLSNLVIPHMVENGGGAIVYIGSGSVFEATSERSFYTCARAAEIQLMKNIAAEFGHANVRCNTISPGMIRSFQTAPIFDDPVLNRKTASSFPMQRGGEPEEIAAAAHFLASRESSYTTGCVISVDGGRIIHARANSLAGVLAANEEDQEKGLG